QTLWTAVAPSERGTSRSSAPQGSSAQPGSWSISIGLGTGEKMQGNGGRREHFRGRRGAAHIVRSVQVQARSERARHPEEPSDEGSAVRNRVTQQQIPRCARDDFTSALG